MGFLDSITDTISSGFNAVVSTAEDVAGTAVNGVEGAVEGAVGTLVQNPLDLLNPFAVLSGAVNGAVQNIEGSPDNSQVISALKNPFTDISQLIGSASDSTTSDLGGSSIEAVLLQLAAKERDALAGKVDQLKNLQAPGANATPQDQSNFDTTKANLMADIQSIEDSIQQITTMATNVQKEENDTNMAIDRNI